LFEVTACGSDDAVDIAKRRARDARFRVVAVDSIRSVDIPSRTEATRWLVWLVLSDRMLA
jgi:hypothetical protein